jgi:hypothetical protein
MFFPELNSNRDIFADAWVQLDMIENCMIVNSPPVEIAANHEIITGPNPVKSLYRIVMPKSVHSALMFF